MFGKYDPDLLLAQAREWRALADTAPKTLRDTYIARATACEDRVNRSFTLPAIVDTDDRSPRQDDPIRR